MRLPTVMTLTLPGASTRGCCFCGRAEGLCCSVRGWILTKGNRYPISALAGTVLLSRHV